MLFYLHSDLLVIILFPVNPVYQISWLQKTPMPYGAITYPKGLDICSSFLYFPLLKTSQGIKYNFKNKYRLLFDLKRKKKKKGCLFMGSTHYILHCC